MRFEAKNGFLKRSKMRNTKNVPKTIGYSHQLWMCRVQNDCSGIFCNQFLKALPKTKPGLYCKVVDFEYKSLLTNSANIFNTTNILCTSEIKLNGIIYKQDQFLLHEFHDEKQFARIVQIILIKNEVCCIANMCKTEYFESHFNAFVISLTNAKMLVKMSSLELQ